MSAILDTIGEYIDLGPVGNTIVGIVAVILMSLGAFCSYKKLLNRNILEILLLGEKAEKKKDMAATLVILAMTAFINVVYTFAMRSNTLILIGMLGLIVVAILIIGYFSLMDFRKKKLSENQEAWYYTCFAYVFMIAGALFSYVAINIYGSNLSKVILVLSLIIIAEGILMVFLCDSIKPKESHLLVNLSGKHNEDKSFDNEDLYVYSRVDDKFLCGDKPVMTKASKVYPVPIKFICDNMDSFHFDYEDLDKEKALVEDSTKNEKTKKATKEEKAEYVEIGYIKKLFRKNKIRIDKKYVAQYLSFMTFPCEEPEAEAEKRHEPNLDAATAVEEKTLSDVHKE